LTALGALLDGVLRGPVDPVLLLGDAGMGKSSLLDAAADLARGRRIRVVRTRSPQGGESSPFAVVADLARGLADQQALLPDGDAAVLREAPRDGSTQSGPVATALLELLAESAHAEPLLLLLDDLQWADPGSLAAVCLAVGRLQSERVAVIGAARPRPPLHPGLHDWDTVAIGPLEMDPAVRVLRAHLPEVMRSMLAADQTQLRLLAERLGRCPIALVEAGRLLTGDQLAGTAPLPDPMPIDEHLLTAWGAAWTGLDAPARTATLALCVVEGSGQELQSGVLAELGLSSDDLDPARSERLLVSGGSASEVGLAHPLIRDAVLTAAGRRRVRGMHRRAAEVAKALGMAPSVIVAHLSASGVPGDEEVIALLLAQAERALADDLTESAGRALVAAAELTLPSHSRGHLAARAAEILLGGSLVADLAPVLSLVEPSSLDALSPTERLWIEWARSEQLGDLDLTQHLRSLEAAAVHAREAGSPALAWILKSAVTAAWGIGDVHAATSHAVALRDLADRAPDGSDWPLPRWARRAVYAVNLFQVGQVAAAHEALVAIGAESRAWRPPPEVPSVQMPGVIVVLGLMGPLDPWVDDLLAQMHRWFVRDGGETQFVLRGSQAERARRRGDFIAAMTLFEPLVALFTSSPSPFERALLLSMSVLVRAAVGDAVGVRVEATRIRTDAGRIGWRAITARAARAEGLLALGEGRVDDALLHLEDLAESHLLGHGPWDAVPMGRADLVEALVRAGEAPRAAEAAASLARTLEPSPDPGARAVVARVRGLVSPGDEARTALMESASAFREAGDGFEEARSRLLLGELLRRDRRIQAARRELRSASAAFERMGAVPWQARALGELRATRAAVPPPTPDALAGLTPQERRVASAVAAGASDRQVAADLFLSTRTVGYHLGHVYQKLGVSSRTALAARLAQAQPAPAQAGPG
jgi:DNA-binding CsgD family transcriptional regulator